MSTSKGRASKRAKIVDNEPMDEDSSNGVGRVICIYLVQPESEMKWQLLRLKAGNG